MSPRIQEFRFAEANLNKRDRKDFIAYLSLHTPGCIWAVHHADGQRTKKVKISLKGRAQTHTYNITAVLTHAQTCCVCHCSMHERRYA